MGKIINLSSVLEKEEKLAVYSVQKGSFLKKSRTLEEHRVQSGEIIMIL